MTGGIFDLMDVLRIMFGIGMMLSAILLISYLVYAIGLLKMFHKMGEPGWKAFVPFVNQYTLFHRVWEDKYFWMQMALFMGGSMIDYLGANWFTGTLRWLTCIAGMVIMALVTHKQSLAFGCGMGMTVLLYLMPPVGTLILGYGDHEYLGPQTDAGNTFV